MDSLLNDTYGNHLSEQYLNISARYSNASHNASVAACTNLQTGYEESVKMVVSIYLFIVFTLGVIGNSTVCFVLGKKKLDRGGDVFIVSLAVADLMSSFTGPLIIFLRITFKDKIDTIVWQKLWDIAKYMASATLVIASYMLLVIAIDRFWAITKPFKARRITKKKKIIACVVVWVFGCAFSSLFMLKDDAYTANTQVIQLMLCAVGWMIPLVAMSVFYVICATALRPQEMPSNSAADRRKQEARNITKMFLIVIFAFCAFVIPVNTKYVVEAIRVLVSKNNIAVCQRMDLFQKVLIHFSFLNGCVNPFIYAKTHPDIKRFMQKIVEMFSCKKNNLSIKESTMSIKESTMSTVSEVSAAVI